MNSYEAWDGGGSNWPPINQNRPNPKIIAYTFLFVKITCFPSIWAIRGAIPDLSGRNLRRGGGSNWPPKKFRQNLEHKIFHIYITLFQNIFDRLHRVTGVEIRYITCLTLNFKIQKFRLFSGFSDFDWWIFHFLSYQARGWLQISFIDHIPIWNHNIGEFWPHRRDSREVGQIDPPKLNGSI